MCGISGLWNYRTRDVCEPEFRAFAESLAHRGPDGSGMMHFPQDRLWLGHRRLSILDISDRGRQPMSYADGRYWLTFNGEIYNFIELRETLRERGYRFTSETDSEIILAAYAEWGPACQLRFNGMWAFAIWDEVEKRLFLSRDRFAVKPLYYADVRGSFSFASELKAFLRLGWCDGSFDQSVVADSIRDPSGHAGVEETLLPRVKRLLGGHCVTVSNGQVLVERWWNTLEHLPAVPGDLASQTERFRELFLDACRLRLRSDVPIATSLSGGLDSSAVACSVAELGRHNAFDHVPDDWQRAFVACFPGTSLDEQQHATEVVKATGMRPHYYQVDPHSVLQQLDTIIYDLETIFNNPLIGAWAIYREMRQNGIRVSLDGHGSDELLGGYHMFVDTAIDELCGPAFKLGRYLDLRRVSAGLVAATDIAGSGAHVGRRRVTQDLRAAARRVAASLGVLEPIRAALKRKSLIDTILPPLPRSNPSDWGDKQGPLKTRLSRELFTWFHAGLLPTFVNCIDRASMAHGIEVRMPFLDWRLVTYCFALPDDSKIGGGYTKRILRLAMQDLMPEPIRLRTAKIHFSSPIGDWSRGPLKAWLLDIANSRAFLEASSWDGIAARALIENAVVGDASIHPVWPLINAHVLQQHFAVQARVKPSGQDTRELLST